MNRDELDRIAWETIKTAAVDPSSPDGLAASGRPKNYAELGQMLALGVDFEFAWSEFLHEFYRHRTAEFFAERPPASLSPSWQALLAGAAEYLSTEFGLPVPEWTASAEYILPEPWDPWEDICPDMEETRDLRAVKTQPAFLKRNVIFEARNLIAL